MHQNHDLMLPRPTLASIDDSIIATYVFAPEAEASGDVVICHGTPFSAAVMLPTARLLMAAGHRVFLWDMPGYGASIGSADQTVDLRSQGRRLAALLDHWGLAEPHVIAHDVGGAVALGAHLLEGRDFASLYLLDAVTLDPWGSPLFRLLAQNQDVFTALPPRFHAAIVREYIAGASAGALGDADWVEALTRPWTTEAGQAAFYRQIAQLTPEHTRPLAVRLGHVRCPTRIGWGERDPWLPVSQAAELASKLPGDVPIKVFPGAGHLVPLEAPKALVDDFLASLGGGSRRPRCA
jgi:pimeloyl-ACP methyl ester carboxylesterase